MPKSRFWSSFWAVAGFLFLLALLQMLADQVFTLFGLVGFLSPDLMKGILMVSQAAVPIWAALTFVDWRWGWKPDNAGLRFTSAARFWLLPGLTAGLVAAGLAHLVTTMPMAGAFQGLTRPVVNLTPDLLFAAVVGVVGAFATELIFRGVVASRFQYDHSGRDLLLLAVGMPLLWRAAGPLIQSLTGLWPSPSAQVEGLGSAALSVFLTLLFLRTNSVWLVAGLRMGLVLGLGLLGLRVTEGSQLIIFGVGSAIMLLLEMNRLRTIQRPGPRGGGSRGGPRKVVYGKTVRGPWGPH